MKEHGFGPAPAVTAGASTQSRETVCRLCGSGRPVPVFPEKLPWVVRCSGCGVLFADPQPTNEELEAIYDDHYYEQFGFVEGPESTTTGLARTKRATYDAMLRVAERHLRSNGHRYRLLDVGCGLGFSLLAAQERGFEAIGLDPLGPSDPHARPGRTILRGTLESHDPGARFDVVSLVDVIEHVRDPVETVRHAASRLEPGGVLLLATNSASSLLARTLGPRWPHLHRAHLWFFTPATLADVVRRGGLRVAESRTAWRTYNTEYIGSILARSTNFPLARRVADRALAWVPERLQRAAWPPIPEGFVLIAIRDR